MLLDNELEVIEKPSLPTILVDTREQKPYTFPGYPVERTALPTADYTIKGFETEILVERKSVSDFLGCIFSDRFQRELERMADCRIAQLVIEGNLYKLEHHHWKGSFNSVLGKLETYPLKYGVYVWLLDDREKAEKFVRGQFRQFYEFKMRHLQTE